MSYETQVKASKSAPEGLAIVARGIDEILKLLAERPADDGWGWSAADEPTGLLTVEEDENGDVTVVLAGVSDEKYASRRSFAENELQLHAHVDTEGDIIHAYGVGGPLWLYTGNRELVMSFPYETRQKMVMDVLEDDPDMAGEMGRDILKDPEAGGAPEGWRPDV